MRSTDTESVLDAAERHALIEIARIAIDTGVRGERPAIRVDNLTPGLRLPRATFVTLTIKGVLRGCIGTLEARRPLAVDVGENAYSAAFDDPRFPPVAMAEILQLDLHISLLNPPQPLVFVSEDDLIEQLRPGVDGLILSDGDRRATFLPSVWESVGGAREFLRHLKLKAGLPPEGWSPTIQAARYTVSSIP